MLPYLEYRIPNAVFRTVKNLGQNQDNMITKAFGPTEIYGKSLTVETKEEDNMDNFL